MPKFKTLDDLPADLTGEVALVRVDLNLPMKDGSATDVTRAEAVKPTMHRNCLRCEGNFLSERADGAWLRMCPNCRTVSHVGAGMEGSAGRQVRGRAAGQTTRRWPVRACCCCHCEG